MISPPWRAEPDPPNTTLTHRRARSKEAPDSSTALVRTDTHNPDSPLLGHLSSRGTINPSGLSQGGCPTALGSRCPWRHSPEKQPQCWRELKFSAGQNLSCSHDAVPTDLRGSPEQEDLKNPEKKCSPSCNECSPGCRVGGTQVPRGLWDMWVPAGRWNDRPLCFAELCAKAAADTLELF